IFVSCGGGNQNDENNKELNGMEFTHRLKLGGSGDFDDEGWPLGRVVSFEVAGNSRITVMGMSSSSSEDRELQIAAGHPDSVLFTFPALGAEISEGVYEYEGDSTTIYMYSAHSGVNIYYLKVEPLATNFKPIDDMKEVRIYPNPATNRVFVNVKKPTQVAICNLSGSMVKSQRVESSNDFIDISDLQSGMYILKSQLNNDFTHKLIVQ
ncbi:MAG: T9SS type A sorting domain-containing protein, partial [Bacteroidota bacterium]